MSCKRAYLVGKGSSLDVVKSEWFEKYPVWCLNQSATVMRKLLPKHDIHCVQNDQWINYVPPEGVTWHCSLSVQAHGREVQRYCQETLTENWASPTCMCALKLMQQQGIDEIIMVGFDSHFDRSRTYAECLNVQSDKIAPFEYYDTLMRWFARDNNIALTWMDRNGCLFDEDFRFKSCILGVAKGDKYERQTDRMIDSFLKYNRNWTAERYYGDRLEKCLPQACKKWSDFDKCEIGRWIAMRDLLNEYDTVLYADGDVRWYSTYLWTGHHELVLTPHTVTDKASSAMRHQIMKDGRANIGIVEVNRGFHHDMMFDYIIGEVLHDPRMFKHGKQLWLQPLVSSCADVGFDVCWNMYAGQNTASWNLRKGDRRVVKENGQFMVISNGLVFPLLSFHFSSKSLHMLDCFGDAVKELKNNYLKEEK